MYFMSSFLSISSSLRLKLLIHPCTLFRFWNTYMCPFTKICFNKPSFFIRKIKFLKESLRQQASQAAIAFLIQRNLVSIFTASFCLPFLNDFLRYQITFIKHTYIQAIVRPRQRSTQKGGPIVTTCHLHYTSNCTQQLHCKLLIQI